MKLRQRKVQEFSSQMKLRVLSVHGDGRMNSRRGSEATVGWEAVFAPNWSCDSKKEILSVLELISSFLAQP